MLRKTHGFTAITLVIGIGATLILLGGASLLAGYRLARRAASIYPKVALRYE